MLIREIYFFNQIFCLFKIKIGKKRPCTVITTTNILQEQQLTDKKLFYQIIIYENNYILYTHTHKLQININQCKHYQIKLSSLGWQIFQFLLT